MHIGITKIRFRMPENHSLKDKRRIVKSILEKIRNRFNVSICEAEDQESWKIATLGLVLVNSDHKLVQQQLSKILEFILQNGQAVELIDHQQEIISGF